MSSSDPQRILIVKLRAIGDVVMATPVIENLRNRFPNSHIAFLTEEASADAVRFNPFLDECIVLPRKSWQQMSWRKSWPGQIAFLRGLRQKRFDLVIDLFGNPRSALLTWMTNAPQRVGYAFRIRKYAYTQAIEPRGGDVHEVEFHLDALRALHIPVRTTAPRLDTPDELRLRAGQWMEIQGATDGRPLVGLNPGGGWAIKRWPPDRFATLADLLTDRYDARILLLWGPGERSIIETVAGGMKTQALLLPEVSLAELCAFLRHCTVVISNDSGPMHMAAAVGVPTVGIFGPTHPVLQGPYGPGHRFIREETVACLGCNRLSCPIGNICMTRLAPETVFDVVRTCFEHKP